MKKTLVTGAGGMVGSHMVEQLYYRGDEVIGVWHKNKKNIEQVEVPVTFVQCDLRYGQNIDWTAVYDSCRQMHLDLFLQAVLKICAVHLGMDENKAGYKAVFTVQDVDEMPLLKDTLTGGIYGAQDENRLHSANMTLNAVSNKTGGKKHKWVTGLLFPSLSYMSHTYPYLKKHRYLLPVAWVQRIHTYLINKGKTNDPRKTVEIGKQRIEMLRKYNLS